jgi:hypothetical protein
LALALLASCSKDIQNEEAVRQGVLDYLRGRTAQIGIDMNNIDVKVTSVSFEKDVARTSVAFTPKNGPGGGGMSMSYVLDRKGEKWVVRGRQSDPANPHGGGQVLPGVQGGPGADGVPRGELPPGHPGVSGQAPGGQLPPGHPSVGTAQ